MPHPVLNGLPWWAFSMLCLLAGLAAGPAVVLVTRAALAGASLAIKALTAARASSSLSPKKSSTS